MEAEDPDYYLYIFTDDELMDVLRNPDEWSQHDQLLAKQILRQRGIAIEGDQSMLTKVTTEDKDAPQSANLVLIIAGYVSVIFAGVAAVVIGLYIARLKKTNTTGERVFAYTKTDRQQGMYIFYLGIAAVIVTVCLRLFVLNFFGYRPF